MHMSVSIKSYFHIFRYDSSNAQTFSFGYFKIHRSNKKKYNLPDYILLFLTIFFCASFGHFPLGLTRFKNMDNRL